MHDNALESEHSPWYLLSGLILGFILGFVITLLLNPNFGSEASPDLLIPSDKDAYRLLIAEAYLANPDILRASSRLELLADPNFIQALSNQAQQSLGKDVNESAAQALAALASALQIESPP